VGHEHLWDTDDDRELALNSFGDVEGVADLTQLSVNRITPPWIVEKLRIRHIRCFCRWFHLLPEISRFNEPKDSRRPWQVMCGGLQARRTLLTFGLSAPLGSKAMFDPVSRVLPRI
jgi:hypothetical protein